MSHELQLAWNTVIHMIDGFFSLLPNLMIALCVFVVFYMLSRLAAKAAFEMTKRANVDQTLSHAIGQLVSVLTNVFGLLVCAVIVVPSFSPDKLIAGLGITSVAIGFAFQNILQNFFAGMLLLWQKPFGIGDEIKTREYEGTVEDIMIRTTVLKTYTGQRVYIPNGILFTDPVTVHTAYDKRQIHLQIPFKDMPDEKAVEIARSALARVNSVAKDPKPEIYVSASNGSTNLDIYLWAGSRNTQIIQATDDAMSAVGHALQAASESDSRKAA
jgi:small conductance mechanosensitive channel